MKKIFCTVIAGLSFLSNVFSQSIGMGTPTPNSSAQLDITSTTHGLLIPRMTTAGVTGISNPAKGLLVYDTVKNQLMVNMGTSGSPNWQTIVANSGWSLGGNSGTNPATQFLGTADNQPLNLRVNNLASGKIDFNLDNVFLGVKAGLNNLPTSQFDGRWNTFVGDSAGLSNTSGSGNSYFGKDAGFSGITTAANSFFGYQAGRVTTGSANSFFGYTSGVANTTGSVNSFFGYFSGQDNTTGTDNSFFGASAGRSNTTGLENAAFGRMAGFTNSTGSYNSFFGGHAGHSTTTGSDNTFVGDSSGYFNTTGGLNSFFGRFAGMNNTTAGANSFFGYAAGQLNTTGSGNTFAGYESGVNNTIGAVNSFFGYLSGEETTIGTDNSFFGASAGRANTTGLENAAFGRMAGFSNATGNYNSFFGGHAGYNTVGKENVFMGDSAGVATTTGNQNVFIGRFAGTVNTTGSQNILLGYGADHSASNLINSVAIGANAQVNASNSMVLGSINGVNGAIADTKVGIGTTTPAARLHISQGSFGGTYLFDDFIVEDNNSTYVNVLSPTANENGILFGLTDNAASGGIVYNNSSTKKGLQFRTFNNTTKMVIDSIGNIGIGTQTPSYTFHVVNNNPADGGFANGIVVENINASTGEAAISFKNTGATGTGSKLWIVGLNQDRNLDFNYGTSLAGANTKMLIDSTGNVGIGNLVPAEKLDIIGNIKVNGNITRPSTGTSNLVPICIGNVTSAGLIVSGTGNFSASNTSTGIYLITITAESYNVNTYSTIVTPIGLSPIMATTSSSAGSLEIKFFSSSGTATNSDFNFVVYKN